MATTGSAALNFGASPGGTDAQTVITGQTGILSGSFVDAWISPAVTADHGVDEHWIEPMQVQAGNIVPGTGFTIYGLALNGLACGQYNVMWIWV